MSERTFPLSRVENVPSLSDRGGARGAPEASFCGGSLGKYRGAHYRLGVHFMGAFDVVEAERHLRTAIHIDPKHTEEARVALCNLLRSQAVPEDFDDAVRTYREAIEANPANDTAHWMLSQLLSMRRDLDVRDGAVLGETQELYDYMRSVPSLRRGSGAPDDGARARRGASGGEARLAQLIECRRKRR